MYDAPVIRERRTIVALVLLAAMGIATEAQAAKAPTTVRFLDGSYGTNQTIYEGDLRSSKSSCEKQRKVTVFRKVTGPDLEIGSVKTDEPAGEGRSWKLVDDGYAIAGTYYAKAKGTSRCKGSRSNDFEFNVCMRARRVDGCRAVLRS
jgi:hypothetical protein